MKQTLALKLLFGMALTLGALPGYAQSPQPTAPQPTATLPGFTANGERACLTCHGGDPKVRAFLQGPMAVKGDPHTPFAQEGCETCHGPSADHAAMKAKTPAIVFNGPNKSPVEVRNQQCLTCHQAGLRMNWQGSQMQRAGLACNDCHTIMTAKDPILVKATQPQKCFTCHAEQRADSFKFSHHPIREGLVVCSDCHNPHGSAGPKLLKEFTVNETCYNCHADKRGPLLWEHEPVRENCLNCHTPHGSTQARLLIQRPPYLCQECHANSGHQSQILAGQNLAGELAANVRMMARGCVNCHSQIHGSNSPNGTFFTR
jgi:DmsE family decaheme c-type cytochrome